MSNQLELSPIARDVIEQEVARIAALGGEWKPTYENLCAVAERVLAAETEEHFKKQAEGIKKAQAAGRKIGRPARKIPDNFDEIFHQLQARERTISGTAQELGVSKTTLDKWISAKKREREE